MIDPKELRIGNLVYASSSILIHHNRPEMVHEIVEGGVNNMAPFYYNPIPLTSEILEKCPDIQNEEGWNKWHEMPDVGFEFAPTFRCWFDLQGTLCIEQYSEGWSELPHIKHLHQLQNLFFALTGQELTVNL